MNKTYKILGKRGRITIPFEIRQKLGFAYNDVIRQLDTKKFSNLMNSIRYKNIFLGWFQIPRWMIVDHHNGIGIAKNR